MASFRSMVLRGEQPVKFAVGAVAQLLRNRCCLSLNPQELVFRANTIERNA